MHRIKIILVLLVLSLITSCKSTELKMGSECMPTYLSLLEGKQVALLVNQTSVVDGVHLVDTLLSRGVELMKVFAPEHGFRGKADAGEHVHASIDIKTGLQIVSLYGNNKKPSIEQLSDVDVVVFDIQDVGARFYTYISSMHYVMEACAEQGKKFIVLDRPNPNGDYVDGPILEMGNKSFVGMHPIPIVHGMTVGELAQMINGEFWLKDSVQCDLTVVTLEGYSHDMPYELPIKPSPNLPNYQSIRLYPSLCLFEGTKISVGRGTYNPFQVIGYPQSNFGYYQFTPQRIDGMSKYPPYQDVVCYGLDLRDTAVQRKLDLSYLLKAYEIVADKENFFNAFFVKLAGVPKLQEQIEEGLTEEEIRASWFDGLVQYKEKRKKYLLYPVDKQ